MKLRFTKMHGAGNDYIYFNCFEQNIGNPSELAIRLSDRHFGIGGDGIVLILPSKVADAKMRMFNADGSEGKMCGNAIRCVAKYLYDNNMVRKQVITIETLSGIKSLNVIEKDGEICTITVDMGEAILESKEIPVSIETDNVVNQKKVVAGNEFYITCVSMGNPHCVVFCDEISDIKIEDIGPLFENLDIFPERINTEFVKVIDTNVLEMRVWERGSGETLACGTGACASVVAAVLNGYCKENDDIKVLLLGGELTINYSNDRVLMTGGATTVFNGIVEV